MRGNKPSDHLRLLHIRDAAQLAIAFISDSDFDQFITDAKTYAATIRQIEIIGEAVYHLSSEFKTAHAHIEWSKNKKTRHILIHEYYELSDIIIWKIVTVHLPNLLEDIEPLISLTSD